MPVRLCRHVGGGFLWTCRQRGPPAQSPRGLPQIAKRFMQPIRTACPLSRCCESAPRLRPLTLLSSTDEVPCARRCYIWALATRVFAQVPTKPKRQGGFSMREYNGVYCAMTQAPVIASDFERDYGYRVLFSLYLPCSPTERVPKYLVCVSGPCDRLAGDALQDMINDYFYRHGSPARCFSHVCVGHYFDDLEV